MRKVLLLGDSIREGYEPYVRELLADEAAIIAPGENGRFAKYTLWGVNLWLKELGSAKIDVIHWNNGLWDVHREAPMTEPLTSVEEYVFTLGRIADELARTGARVVFATTTPVAADAVGRTNEEIDHYNSAAVQLMKERGIAVNDLNAALRPRLNEYICSDRLHLTEAGSRQCAGQVAAVIRALL
ncbi:SGNH/GDSL hydrolase family protein [Paenibacillus kobensis]|uniref:SGNH/GDSL hydrolase family protein n=1 Tax=Paenibacillus kobensis TaxID=59841 RepID=UPI000FDA67F5|nr:SGNH/GDSL hydrolase family protein [Paenibacillus kobensis]